MTPDRLTDLNARPEMLLSHEEWREREELRWMLWRRQLAERVQTPEVREFHERHGRKPGQPVSPLSFEDKYRSEQDQQRREERG